ncbi:unnamed protein product [Psylliodes chrysocephalus]|uniref:THAP-type domain-containing protein n=1 Tax=Psylliodes chrysocephalus TaxID=3402493 RepID=A0A9P0CG14_9CUCU|nr:unnamed protein product [Psylliodes chrysocephala]
MNLMPQKQLGSQCNGESCSKRNKKCSLFSDGKRQEIMQNFYPMGSLQLQREYIARCIMLKNTLGFVGNHKCVNLSPEECSSRIKVCSLHFSEDSYKLNAAKNRLTKNATPLINLHTKKYKATDKGGEDIIEVYVRKQIIVMQKVHPVKPQIVFRIELREKCS